MQLSLYSHRKQAVIQEKMKKINKISAYVTFTTDAVSCRFSIMCRTTKITSSRPLFFFSIWHVHTKNFWNLALYFDRCLIDSQTTMDMFHHQRLCELKVHIVTSLSLFSLYNTVVFIPPISSFAKNTASDRYLLIRGVVY